MKFKRGELVNVTVKVEKEEGWIDHWATGMDKFIGNNIPYLVSKVDAPYGVSLTDPATGKNTGYSWPHGALTLAKPKVFNIGDSVRVSKKVEDEEKWALHWVSAMDVYVGGVYKVVSVDADRGYTLNLGKGAPLFAFPPSSLEVWIPTVATPKVEVPKVSFNSSTDQVFCIDTALLKKDDLISFIARVDYEVDKLKQFYVKQASKEGVI
jgi:hypothetical protein